MYKSPRGTSDILPENQMYWRILNKNIEKISLEFAYERIDTPIIEDANLFVRGIGELTDIVEKETYTFKDRGDNLLTLRPEGTAPICRAYLQHGMQNSTQPTRLYYVLPNFRYERPQSGRYRQHPQFGAENIGESDPYIDCEIIEYAWRFLQSVGLSMLNLEINSIGDKKCRPKYITDLKEYYNSQSNNLCKDCTRRLNSNTLRLLDCKNSDCQEIISKAPNNLDYLCNECKAHWQLLLLYLKDIKLPYKINSRLVRGFDYYTRTVFEISSKSNSSPIAIAGGGRYDGLIQELGGPETPGIGFGIGIERVILELKNQKVSIPKNNKNKVVIASIGVESRHISMHISSILRKNGITTIVGPSSKNLRRQLKYASSINSTHVIIIGDEEIQKNTLIIKNLTSGVQNIIPNISDEIIKILK